MVRSELIISEHARQSMAHRNVSEDDIWEVLVGFSCFKYSRSYNLNLWGRDCSGRILRVTLVPEIPLVTTVAEQQPVQISQMLAAKANRG